MQGTTVGKEHRVEYLTKELAGIQQEGVGHSHDSSEACHFVRMPYESYKHFANDLRRDEYELLNETLPDLLPGFKSITRSKKVQLLNNFEEV